MNVTRRASLAALMGMGVGEAWASTVPPATHGAGPVMALGGSVRFDNPLVWPRLVEAAGGPGARIAVMSMASGQSERVARTVQRVFERHGARAEWVAVAPNLPGLDLAQAVQDPRWIEMVRDSDAVFFTGGAQARIVDTLAPGGMVSPLLQAVRDRHQRGGLVAGTSAGAAILSHVMFRDAPFVTSVLKGQLRAGREFDQGLGFVDRRLFVDQHFLKRGRIGRMIPLMIHQGFRFGLGVEEDSAVLIRDTHLTLVGGRGALVADLGEAVSTTRNGALSLQGARLHLLDPGDRFDLADGRLHPQTHKLAQPVAFRQPGFDPTMEFPRYFMDILGDYAIADAMIQLVDGPRPEVRGLAHSAVPRPGDARPDLAFEFILRRDDRTRAWSPLGVGADTYSITDVCLDIEPVRMASPLFQPWATGT